MLRLVGSRTIQTRIATAKRRTPNGAPPTAHGPDGAGPRRRKTQTARAPCVVVVRVLRRSGPASFGPCVVRAVRRWGRAPLGPCAVYAVTDVTLLAVNGLLFLSTPH